MASTTEISVTNIDYPALSPDSRQMKIIEANLGGEAMQESGLDPELSLALGGATTWNYEVDGNTKSTDELTGVLVGVGKKGVLWPEEDPSDAKPVIVSSDLLVGHRVSDDLGSIDPDVLEKYRIGDRKYDRRRWLMGLILVSVLVAADLENDAKKVACRLCSAKVKYGLFWFQSGAGSLRNIIPFLKRLPCFQHEAVIGLRLEKAKGRGG